MTSSNNFGAGHTHIFGHNTNKSKQYEVKKKSAKNTQQEM